MPCPASVLVPRFCRLLVEALIWINERSGGKGAGDGDRSKHRQQRVAQIHSGNPRIGFSRSI
jgi:hypothetical protein